MTSLLVGLLMGTTPLSPQTQLASSEGLQQPWVQLGDQREPGSLAISWHGPAVEEAYRLTYRQGNRIKSAMVTSRLIDLVDVAPHRVYWARVNGLRPGQPVSYELSLGRSVRHRGEVMAPKADHQTSRFAVFGDCGIGLPVQAQLGSQIYRSKPDFVLITGDIVYDNGEINEYRKNFFPYFATEKLPLLSSSLIVGLPGNHDTQNKNFREAPDSLAYYYYWNQPLNGPITRPNQRSATPFLASYAATKAFMKTAGEAFPRMANFSFDYGNAHWLCLDANPYVDWTDPTLRKWVLDDLKRSKKTWKFVAFHHPGFHSSEMHQAQKQMRQAADLFEDGGVDVVFSGHVHNYQRSFPIQVGPKRGAAMAELAKDDWPVDRQFDGKSVTKPRGVIYIVDGAGGARLYNAEFNGKPERWKPFQAEYIADFSFSLVTLQGRRFSLVQIDKDGKERDQFVVTK